MSDSNDSLDGLNWLDLDASLVSRETTGAVVPESELSTNDPIGETESSAALASQDGLVASDTPAAQGAQHLGAGAPTFEVRDRSGEMNADELTAPVDVHRTIDRDDHTDPSLMSSDGLATDDDRTLTAPPLTHVIPITPSSGDAALVVKNTTHLAGTAGDPAASLGNVSRETLGEPSVQTTEGLLGLVSRETALDAGEFTEAIRPEPGLDAGPVQAADYETPIARETAQAIHVLNVRQELWPSPARTRVMTVANQKGGVGKTTSAVNIAAALALHGLRVLLIDLDPQGNASTALGIEHGVGTPSIYDVLLGGLPLGEVAQVADFAPSLRCVPSTLDLAGADIELTSQVAREYRLQRALSTFLESEHAEVDYVLIDCPPSLGLLTLNALVAAREVLLPIQCEYYALEGLAQLLKTVDLVNSHLNPDLVVTTVLLTMYDSRTRLADQVADEVRRHFGDLVLAPTIPRNVRVSEAPGYGQTVITYDPGSRGAIGYVQAAHEIAVRGARGDHESSGGMAAGNGSAGVAEGDA